MDMVAIVSLGQPRIIIYENLVEPTFPMLYTMSQTHLSFDIRDDFKGIYLAWTWWPSWSCGLKQIEILIRFGPGQISS